jgi:hypothetical protein
MPNSPPPPSRKRKFNVEELLGDPPAKRKPSHFIENIIDVEAEGRPKPVSHYVRKLERGAEYNERFKYVKTKSRFSIENLPYEPEALLPSIFQSCMDQAMEESRAKGIEPTHLGVLITSEKLIKGDLWIPIRQINADTLNNIVNRFEEVAQSRKDSDGGLYGAPFTVIVGTVDRNSLPRRKKKLEGAGGKKKDFASIRHTIAPSKLIKV